MNAPLQAAVRVFAVSVALALTSVASVARAQRDAGALEDEPQAEVEPPDAAQREFAAAGVAFAEDDYPAALAHYRRAFELRPHDVVRFNIAVCLERLGRFREAAGEYELAAQSTELGASERTRAQDLAARVRERLGRLVITGSPAGAEVFEGSARVCTLPCETAMDPGAHALRVRRDGHVAEERTVTISRGATTELSVTLTSEPSAAVELSPERAVAASDGGPGWGTWLGLGLFVIGAGAAVAAGIHTQALHDAYEQLPSPSLRDEGLLFRGLFFAAVGTAALGAVLVLVDLVFLSADDEDERAARALRIDARGAALSF